jgi:hypothetical protein
VLTEDDRLAYTPVDVLETIGEDVLVRGPLNDGQRICLTRLLGVPAGTRVTALPATAQPRGVIAN